MHRSLSLMRKPIGVYLDPHGFLSSLSIRNNLKQLHVYQLTEGGEEILTK